MLCDSYHLNVKGRLHTAPHHKVSKCRHTAALCSIALAYALAIIYTKHGLSALAICKLALKAIASLSEMPVGPAHGLGTPLATGEAPLAQACFLFSLEASVIALLPDAALRHLLQLISDRCTDLLGDCSPLLLEHVPEAMVLLATMCSTISAIGNVQVEEAAQLRDTAHRLLISSPPVVSRAAAAVLGQLAAVDGANAAQMMSDYLSLVTLQTASLGSQSGSQQGAGFSISPASSGVMPCPYVSQSRSCHLLPHHQH